MAEKILNIATFGLAGALFGGKKKSAPTPAPEPGPRVMPIADDAAVRRAKTRSILSRSRSGRTSTMLSADSDSLGA